MTEEAKGGPTPDPEARASATPAAEETVAAVAVADEPAEPVSNTGTLAEADAPATTAEAPPSADVMGDAPAANDGLAVAADPLAEAPEAEAAEAVEAAPEALAAAEPEAAAEASVEAVAPIVDAEPEAAAEAAAEPATEAAEPEAVAEPAETASAAAEPAPETEAVADEAVAEAPPAPPAPVYTGPEPTTMEELLAEQDGDIKSFKHGDVVEGTVVRIDKDEILVDIGAKSEGVVSNRELYGRHAESQPALNIGDTVLVYVLQPESPEGHVVLSLRRAGLERKWRSMQEQFEAGVIIEAPVIDHNKGGLIVDCGIRGFVPISQIVDFPRRPQNDQPRDAAQEIAEKLQPFVGRKLRLKILEVNRKANRLILSEKVALYEERREKRDELFSSLQVGQKVTGTVRSIAPFGVFIDLGGIDGLVHKSELSWNKVNNPEAGYKVGDEVDAEVIDINHERGRISLSIRRLQPDPWHSTVADFKVGDVIDGTVTKLVNFGAFVRVRDGLEGLIHISELSHQRVAHPGDVVHEGQSLKLKIISLDSERHRLGLSLKQAEEPPVRASAPEALPAASPSAGPRPEREPRRPRERDRDRDRDRGERERSYSSSDAVQEPEGGIDNTLAGAFAGIREQLAAAEAAEEEPAPAPKGKAARAAAAAESDADAEPVAEAASADGVAEPVADEAMAEAIAEPAAEAASADGVAEPVAEEAMAEAIAEPAVTAEETAAEAVAEPAAEEAAAEPEAEPAPEPEAEAAAEAEPAVTAAEPEEASEPPAEEAAAASDVNAETETPPAGEGKKKASS